MRPLGVTIDNVDHVDAVVAEVSRYRAPLYVRVVCDPGVEPISYRSAVEQLAPHCKLILSPIDSASAALYLSVSDYVSRVTRYARFFRGGHVWAIETGNEVNGDWLGVGMGRKASRARDVVLHMGYRNMTTYFCDGRDTTIRTWTARDAIEHGVEDLVGLSVYPYSAGFVGTQWTADVETLARLFPASTVCVGEYGVEGDLEKPQHGAAQLLVDRVQATRFHAANAEAYGFYWDFLYDACLSDRLRNQFRALGGWT